MLALGTEAPDFTADSSAGEIRFHDWLEGHWGLLFSYPKAFTSICGSELVEVARLRDDFDTYGVKVAALSLDSATDQKQFSAELEKAESCPVGKIMQISDPNGLVAKSYGMIHPQIADKMTIRTSYVIGPDRKVRMSQAGPPVIPRDFKSLLTGIRALQDHERS